MFPFPSAMMMSSGAAGLNVSSLFKVNLYTANNGGFQEINSGLDLLGKGGVTWRHGRDVSSPLNVMDTVRGPTPVLQVGSTNAEVSTVSALTYTNSGYSWTGSASNTPNGGLWASWTFLQNPRFLSVIPFTANASGGATFDTGLAVGPTLSIGQIEIKSRSVSGNWLVYHRSLGTSQQLIMNSLAGATSVPNWISISGSVVTIASGRLTANATYIAYVRPHDTAPDGVVYCGLYDNGAWTLPWLPQWTLFKQTPASQFGGQWYVVDTTRGWTLANAKVLDISSLSATEPGIGQFGSPSAPEFANPSIYVAIRAPG